MSMCKGLPGLPCQAGLAHRCGEEAASLVGRAGDEEPFVDAAIDGSRALVFMLGNWGKLARVDPAWRVGDGEIGPGDGVRTGRRLLQDLEQLTS